MKLNIKPLITNRIRTYLNESYYRIIGDMGLLYRVGLSEINVMRIDCYHDFTDYEITQNEFLYPLSITTFDKSKRMKCWNSR